MAAKKTVIYMSSLIEIISVDIGKPCTTHFWFFLTEKLLKIQLQVVVMSMIKSYIYWFSEVKGVSWINKPV